MAVFEIQSPPPVHRNRIPAPAPLHLTYATLT